MTRSFQLGLSSAGVGLLLGAAQGVATGSLIAFLSLFALITLIGALSAAVFFGRHHRDDPEGYVGLGDTLLAIGTLIVIVEAVFFTISGELLSIVYLALVVSLTFWALKQERQVAIAVSGLMSVLALSWVMTDRDAVVIGTVPALLWVFSAGAYAASLAAGEQIRDVVTS